MLPTWKKCVDFYEGTNLSLYIRRHARESIASHASRASTTTYRNFTQPVVDLYIHYIFSKQIVRAESEKQQSGQPRKSSGTGKQEWVNFHTNVDRQGTPIDRFMAEVGRWAFIFGHSVVLVDLPRLKDAQLRSEADRLKHNVRPYFSLYSPVDVTNWDEDHEGKLHWIRFREPLDGVIDPFHKRSREEEEQAGRVVDNLERPKSARFRTWTRDAWYLHELRGDNVKLVDSQPHWLGEVPAVFFYNRRLTRRRSMGLSLVSDIVGLNQEILNMDSLIAESVYQSVLNILVLGQQPEEEEEIIIGANNVLTYRGERAPYFLSPSTAPLDFMEQRVQRMREEIWRLAKLGGGLGIEPRAAQSGVSLAFEFNESNRMLAERADELESGEFQLHRLWHRWFGREWEGLVNYPEEFSINSFEQEVAMLTSSKQVMRSPTFTRTLEKRVMKRLLPGIGKETIEAIEKEIDLIPDMVSTFTGPVFYDAILQQTNPAGGGNPVGEIARLIEFMNKQQKVGEGDKPSEEELPTEEDSGADQ